MHFKQFEIKKTLRNLLLNLVKTYHAQICTISANIMTELFIHLCPELFCFCCCITYLHYAL